MRKIDYIMLILSWTGIAFIVATLVQWGSSLSPNITLYILETIVSLGIILGMNKLFLPKHKKNKKKTQKKEEVI